MNIEEFREYCLSLGEVTEKTPFGKFLCRAKRQGRLAARFNSHPLVELKVDSVLVFYVCNHMFCMVDMDNFHYAVVKNYLQYGPQYDTVNDCPIIPGETEFVERVRLNKVSKYTRNLLKEYMEDAVERYWAEKRQIPIAGDLKALSDVIYIV